MRGRILATQAMDNVDGILAAQGIALRAFEALGAAKCEPLNCRKISSIRLPKTCARLGQYASNHLWVSSLKDLSSGLQTLRTFCVHGNIHDRP